MSGHTVYTILQKELLELTRDRRTLISMVVVPLIAIPLLFLAMGQFVAARERRAQSEALEVAVAPKLSVSGVREALESAGFSVRSHVSPRRAVENKQAAAGLDTAATAGGDVEIRLYIDRTRQASSIAGDKLRIALDGLKAEQVRAALKGSGVSEKVLTPFVLNRINVAPQEKMAGFVLGSIIGYIVILLMFSGCMYPAIDMTAGEKERRTLEILLASPAGRDEIVLGKILAATTAAFLTAFLSVTSLVVSFRFGPASGHLQAAFAGARIEPGAVALVLLAVLPTAVTAASLMIAISLFAKSFKEGQSYLTPLIMLVVFPAVLGMLPGAEASPMMAVIPVFNVSQLIKAIFLGEVTVPAFLLTFVSNLGYAAIAFLAAVQIFKRESVLFRA